MRKILLAGASLAMLAGCAVGKTSSSVEHTMKYGDGSERSVAHNTWGVGAFKPSEGANALETANADLTTAYAGQVDKGRWLSYGYGHGYGYPYYAYGNLSPVVVHGQTLVDLTEAHRLDREFGPGASYAPVYRGELPRQRQPRPIVQRVYPPRARQRAHREKPKEEKPQTCISPDTLQRFSDWRTEITGARRASPGDVEECRRLVEEGDELLRDAQRECARYKNNDAVEFFAGQKRILDQYRGDCFSEENAKEAGNEKDAD